MPQGVGRSKAILTLNVGSGADIWGDVRLDNIRTNLFYKSTANLFADAEHLPFRDDSFLETKLRNVLEHMVDWRVALREAGRVSSILNMTIPYEAHHAKTSWLLLETFISILKLRPPPRFWLLPSRVREHLWQFKDRIGLVESELERLGFNGSSNLEFLPVISQKLPLVRRLRRPSQYRIVAQKSAISRE